MSLNLSMSAFACSRQLTVSPEADYFRYADMSLLTRISANTEINIVPAKPDEFSTAQAGASSQQHQRQCSKREFGKQSLELFRGEDVWCLTPFR